MQEGQIDDDLPLDFQTLLWGALQQEITTKLAQRNPNEPDAQEIDGGGLGNSSYAGSDRNVGQSELVAGAAEGH